MERCDDNKDDNHNDTNLTSTNHIVAYIQYSLLSFFPAIHVMMLEECQCNNKQPLLTIKIYTMHLIHTVRCSLKISTDHLITCISIYFCAKQIIIKYVIKKLYLYSPLSN